MNAGRSFGRAWRAAGLAAALLVAASGAACSNDKGRPRPVQPERAARDIPSVLRGTIGAESRIIGEQPMLISGYGIVVGLKATGASDIHPGVRVMLEREMSRRGVGKESAGMGWTTPARMLDDPNTAVVLVQAAMPPGAAEGQSFDIAVQTLPGSSTTSLEGGRLWTTDLRTGIQLPGSPDTETVAEATGPIFINPFADPAKQGEDAINRTSGRVLSGGVTRKPRELVLALDNPSHARARSVTAAINARFPQGRSRKPTAWGVNEELIRINVPLEWQGRAEEFIEVLKATRVDIAYPQEYARRYARALREQPELATELSFRLQALGDAALPELRKLYEFGETSPRLAALRAGARLGDALTAPHLRDIALSGEPALRTQAIALLADLGPDPQVNRLLRELLDADQIEIRIAAYEALAKRVDPNLDRRPLGDKFVLDVIPAKRPLIYVSQQGVPRIVLFGGDLTLKRPVLASGWSDRLMVASDSPTDKMVRVYYRDFRTNIGASYTAPAELMGFIRFMAHETTPEEPAPGLNLSYSEVVGALHELWKGGAIDADFIAEQDKVAAELLRSRELAPDDLRPEFDEGDVPPAPDTPESEGEGEPGDPPPPAEERPEFEERPSPGRGSGRR